MKDVSNKRSPPENRQEKRRTRLVITAVAIILLLTFTSWAVYLETYLVEGESGKNIEIDHYINEVIDLLKTDIILNATELIESNVNYLSNTLIFQVDLNRNIELIINDNYRPYNVKELDIEIIVNYVSVEVSPSSIRTNDLIRYPSVSDDDHLDIDLATVGRYYDTIEPFGYRLKGQIYYTTRQLDQNNEVNSNKENQAPIYFEELIDSPFLFIEYKLNQFQSQSNTAYSDLARMVKYMLNTVARMRVYYRDHSEQSITYSHKNILNEGDVELAVNLALILEEALIFRAYDKKSSQAVDSFFYDRDNAELLNNPTGKRQWGSSELANYNDYLIRRNDQNVKDSRLLQVLLNKYVNNGYIDPADILSLYLVMDEGFRPAIIDSPKDTIAILQEQYETKYLMDPKEINDPSDTTNLKYILTLPRKYENGFDLNYDNSQKGLVGNLKLELDQQPDYLISGRDFKVTGLENPKGWYSTAELRQLTRTPSVVPERPKDHDDRLNFDLDIKGNVRINVRTKQSETLYSKDIWHSKEISFDFPVNVYVWFNYPSKVDSITPINFNSGGTTPDGWIITTESHIIEYFESNFWKYLKPFVSVGFDELFSILPLILSQQGLRNYHGSETNLVDVNIMDNNIIRSNWLTDILISKNLKLKAILESDLDTFAYRFDIFMRYYFLDYLRQYNEEYDFFNYTTQPQFPFNKFVPWLTELGYDLSLLYNVNTNILNITVEQNNGYFSIFIHGYNQSSEKLKIDLVTYVNLPGLITITSTISSYDLQAGRPVINAKGILYDKYHFDTTSFPRPSSEIDTNTISDTSDDSFLITRSKFGPKVQVSTLEFINLNLYPEFEEIDLRLTINIPEHQSDSTEELNDLISSIEIPRLMVLEDEKYIQDRYYISKFVQKFCDDLLMWIAEEEFFPTLALKFSVSSTQNYDFNNMTIYLTELSSSKTFLNWFEENGLEMIMAICKPDALISEIVEVMVLSDVNLEIDYLEKIDIEFTNRVLDHEIQKSIKLDNQILELYQIPDSKKEKLTMITALTGTAIISFAKGLLIKEEQGPTSSSYPGTIETFSQVYYAYENEMDSGSNIKLLLGTTWTIKL